MSFRLIRLRLVNFQSIEDSEIKLGHITIIRGVSDSGKSAVVRALRCLVTANFKDNHIKQGAEKLVVTAITSRGSVSASRCRKGEISYEVTPDGGAKTKFTKCYKALPSEAKNILGLEAINDSDMKDKILNIYQQFDGQFPLDQPASVLNRILGSVNNVHVIFYAIKEGQQERYSKLVELKVLRQNLEKKKEQLEHYIDLEDQKRFFAHLKLKNEEIRALDGRVKEISQNLANLKRCESNLAIMNLKEGGLSCLLGGFEDFEEALKSWKEIQAIARKHRESIRLVNIVRGMGQKIMILNSLISLLDGVLERGQRLSRLRQQLNQKQAYDAQLEILAGKYQEIEERKKDLVHAIDRIEICPLLQDSWALGCKERIKNV